MALEIARRLVNGIWHTGPVEEDTGGGITEVTSADLSVTITDPTGPVVDLSAVGGAGAVTVTSVTLTDAQIKTLPTTSVQILAEPGAGKYHFIAAAIIACDTTAANYTNVSPTGTLRLEMGSQLQGRVLADIFANLFEWGGKLSAQVGAFTAGDVPTANTNIWPNNVSLDDGGNVPLLLVCSNDGNGNFTGGNAANTMKVTVLYAVEDIL